MESEEAYGLYPYRWAVLGSYMFVGIITQLMWLTYAPITSSAQKLMGVSEFKIVFLSTLYPLLYIPLSIPAGMVVDRKGFRFAVLLGASLTAIPSFLRLCADNYALVLTSTVFVAAGQPFVLNSSTKLVSTWFPTEESGRATGLYILSLFVGMMITLALTPALLKAWGEENLSSLRYIILLYGSIAVLGLLVFTMLAKPRPPKPPRRSEHEVAEKGARVSWKSIRTIMSLSDFRRLCLIMFVNNGCFISLLQLLEKILRAKGISAGTAGSIGAVTVLAGAIGCMALPSLSDRVMRRKPFLTLIPFAVIPALALVGMLQGVTFLYIVGTLLGFFLFSAYPLVLILAEETTGPALTGTATSILMLLGNTGGFLLTLAMEIIKGATGGSSGSFSQALLFIMLLFVFDLVAAIRLREGVS